MKHLSIVILAAGKGTRLLSAQPKVLHCIGGRPILYHTLKAALELNPSQLIIVHNNTEGTLKSAIAPHLPDIESNRLNGSKLRWVAQHEPLGTAHAVQQTLPHLKEEGKTLVLFGDTPLINAQMVLKTLLNNTPDGALGLITTYPDDPAQLGRVIRNEQGEITRIIEHKDATAKQREHYKEVFSGLMLLPNKPLAHWLSAIKATNKQNEYYLTDIVSLAKTNNAPVVAAIADSPQSLQGINTQKDLADAERFYQRTTANRLLLEGVRIADPDRLDVRGTVQFGRDVFLDINTVLEGQVIAGNHVHIGTGCYLRNVHLGDHVYIKPYSVIDGSTIDAHSVIGPFAHLRAGTHLGEHTKIGNFVETKNTTLGAHSKASHLTYLGDASIGKQTNIGAGTITCNYDGKHKHPTTIGDQALIGAGCQLVAPIAVGDGALVGAGSVLTKNAPSHKLTLSRSQQKTTSLPKRKKTKNTDTSDNHPLKETT